jgi:hypothetical protein
VSEDLIHRVDLIVAGIARWNRKYFLIPFFRVDHVEDTDRPHFDQAAGEAGFLNEDEHVHRVIVFCERPGNEAVVARVVHRRI